jgi:hypothetical protein
VVPHVGAERHEEDEEPMAEKKFRDLIHSFEVVQHDQNFSNRLGIALIQIIEWQMNCQIVTLLMLLFSFKNEQPSNFLAQKL